MDFTKEQVEQMIAVAVKEAVAEAITDDGDGHYVTGGVKGGCLGDWLIAVATKNHKRLAEYKTMEVGVGAAGGFMVPTAFKPQLLAIPPEDSIVRPKALVIDVGDAAQVNIPSLDQTGDPGADKTHRFGGVHLTWTEEGGSKDETEPGLKLVTLVPHELSGFCYVTDKLLRCSPMTVDKVLTKLFRGAIADELDYRFITGGGVAMPQGVISAGATIQPNRAGADHIVYADVMAIYHDFLHDSGKGIWLISPCAIEEILTLRDADGRYLWNPNVSGQIPTQLLGYPIKWTEKVPALGTKGDIGLYDFSRYVIADGENITVQASPHFRWTENITTFRFFSETDGQPWLTAPLYLRGGDHQVSPFVALDIPA